MGCWNGKGAVAGLSLLASVGYAAGDAELVSGEVWVDGDDVTQALHIGPGSVAELTAAIDAGALSAGAHALHLTVTDGAGNRSSTLSQSFHRPLMAPGQGHHNRLTAAELFIDEDPDQGAGTAFPVPIDGLFDQTFEKLLAAVDLSALTTGRHTLYVRYRDLNGNWSIPLGQSFWLPAGARPVGASAGNGFGLVAAEAYFDRDPGEGNGSALPVALAGDFGTARKALDLSGLSVGPHSLYVRFKDTAGRWSRALGQSLFISSGLVAPTGNGAGVAGLIAGDFAIDGGSYTSAAAEDGAWGGVVETINLAVPVDGGYHAASIRFHDSAGRVSASRAPENWNEGDLDWDGLPDPWELGVFGHLDAHGRDDSDFDGRNNAEEYRLGSNPLIAEGGEASTSFNELVRALELSASQVAPMQLGSHLEETLSRAEAAVLLDAYLSYLEPGFRTDASLYPAPFADVDPGSVVYPAVVRLAHYRGTADAETVLTRENGLFRPLDRVTRQEFLKMLLQGIDLPLSDDDGALTGFDDYADIQGTWAARYFNTAVLESIMVGNANHLYPLHALTVREALYLLYRSTGLAAHSGEGTHFIDPAALTTEPLLRRQIGIEYEPAFYEPEATPIELSGITVTGNDPHCAGGVALSADYAVDSASVQVSTYFWWKADNGYFREHPSSTDYARVCFFGNAVAPAGGYLVRVSGGDNIGYVDDAASLIASDAFGYANDTVTGEGLVAARLELGVLPAALRAGRAFELDLSAAGFSKSELDVGIERVLVSLIAADGRVEPLFSGQTYEGRVRFTPAAWPELYGQMVRLHLQILTQDIERTLTTAELRYIPRFVIAGRIVNSDVEQPAPTHVTIGTKGIPLDDDLKFHYELDVVDETAIDVTPHSPAPTNSFAAQSITFTWAESERYVIFVGSNQDPDGDGVLNSDDLCPRDSDANQADLDHDGIGDACDPDIDGDGVADAEDSFPGDSSEQFDTDDDGIGDNADLDDDNDGIADGDDAFPYDAAEWFDADGDGAGDNADPDDDNDGIADAAPDNCPFVANPDQGDSDGDGVGDVCDETDAFCWACLPSRSGWRVILQ